MNPLRFVHRGGLTPTLLLALLVQQAELSYAQTQEAPSKQGLEEEDLRRHTTKVLGEEEKARTTQEIRQVMVENMEQSYVSFGSGIRTGSDQTAGNLLYEGQIFINFNLISRETIWLDFPIRFVVRQYDEPSQPVLTPTYNPGVRVMWWWAGDRTGGPNSPIRYLSLGLHHYSNGQNGPALLGDGSVNTRNGSFNTNYAEAALHWTQSLYGFQWLRLSWRHHFTSGWDDAQVNQYEKDHLSAKLRTGEWTPQASRWYATLTATYSYSGRDYVVWNTVDPTRNVEADTSDNLHFTAELTFLPTFFGKAWKDVGLYARYDHGYDYYNINFQHKMNRIQVGLASTNY